MTANRRKTAIAFLLAFALLLSACGGKEGPEEASEPPEEPTESVSSSDTSAGNEPLSVQYRTNIALQKTYTGPEAVDSYPDSFHSELTDGLRYADSGLGYQDPCWSDYGRPDPVEIVVDLGEVYAGIYAFGISYLVDMGPGIGSPQSVRVYTSEDGEDWKLAARIRTEAVPEDGAYLTTGDAKTLLSARYVRFSMAHYAANLFLDELLVYADVAPADDTAAVRELVNQAFAADAYGYSAALSALATGKTDPTLPEQVLSAGASYTSSRQPGQKHPDGGKLTDNAQTGAAYESGAFVGYEGAEALDCTVTLPAEAPDVSVFEAFLYCNATLGATAPAYLDVSVEQDGQFVTVGRVYAPETVRDGAVSYRLALPVTVRTQRVAFSFPAQERSLLLLEELSVGACREKQDTPFVNFYSEIPIERVAKPVYFPASGKSYGKRINLISGLTQRIFSYVPLAAGTFGNSPEDSPLLTDGAYASNASYTDPAYCKFGGGEARDVVYDFGALAAVDGFSLSFLREDDVGINDLVYVMFYLSDDGVDWYGVHAAALPSSQATEFLRYDYALDRVYRARFARFSFRVRPNVYCDELQVWGNQDVTGSVPLAESGRESTPLNKGAYAPRDVALGGANDIVLLPNYSAADEAKNHPNAGFTEEELLPYVAYLDRDGKILDTMFDGVLFCPTGNGLNGGHFYENATQKEMQDLFDKTFLPGRDVDALERAAARTAEALGLADYKVRYYIPLFHAGVDLQFGDIDGDGVSDTLDSFEKRVAAVQWEMDYILSLVGQRTDSHIQFSGFYWQNESLDARDDEPLLLQAISASVKERGFELFWIPYYKAPGYETWAFDGFSIACMQPNAAFNRVVNQEYIGYCAQIAKRLGMCVEMEMNDASLVDPIYFEKYMQYLRGGETYGFMTETPHFYYQSIDIFLQACQAESDRSRLLYTDTHAFIKGELPRPEPLTATTFSGNAGEMLSATLNATGTDAESYRMLLSPEHGTVTLCDDGSFVYYPETDFSGEDRFLVVKSNFLYDTDPVEITLKIAP